MRADLLRAHAWLHGLTRREAVELTAKAGAVGALAGLGLGAQVASAAPAASRDGSSGRFTDEMFDVQAVLGGAWDETAFYRRGDQHGTLHLGEPMFDGFPAFPSSPPRVYDQRLVVLGYDPPPGFDGILQSRTPLGPNWISAHEERFNANYSHQIGTQLDNLNHIGVGPVFYGGHRGPDIAESRDHRGS
jgi:hypothetical protein